MKSCFKVMIFSVCGCAIANVVAQKLPAVQQGSLRAPATVKVDGKPLEWGDHLQAYNSSTEIFYTLSNDDKNLYLTVQSSDHTIINKIFGGGVTLTINSSAKKSAKDAVSVTYPVFDKKNRIWVNLKAKPELIPGSAASAKAVDSFVNVNNQRFAEKSRYIMVTGVKGMDTLISVYNQDGIKTAALFDNKMTYTYELAIDLKLLGLTPNSNTLFAYNIKLSGLNTDLEMAAAGVTITRNEKGDIASINVAAGASKNMPSLPYKVSKTFDYPTDFWGTYTLAK